MNGKVLNNKGNGKLMFLHLRSKFNEQNYMCIKTFIN